MTLSSEWQSIQLSAVRALPMKVVALYQAVHRCLANNNATLLLNPIAKLQKRTTRFSLDQRLQIVSINLLLQRYSAGEILAYFKGNLYYRIGHTTVALCGRNSVT